MTIKLKKRDYSLVDVLETLIHFEDRLIKYVTLEQLYKMTEKGDFDKVPPSVLVKIYRTDEDKKKDNHFYAVFSNHGLIPMVEGDVLAHHKLDEPHLFWDYRVEGVDDQVYSEDVVFSDHHDACEDWQAALHFENIFETFYLDGGHDHAILAGFYFIK